MKDETTERNEGIPHPTTIPEFGRCNDNPPTGEHVFRDVGARFGALRWRCEFCNKSQVELREAVASLG